MRRASLIAGGIATALALLGPLTSESAPAGSSAHLLDVAEGGTSPGGAFPPGGGSGVTGSGAAGRVAVWSSSTKLTGYSTLTSDSAGDLTVGGALAIRNNTAGAIFQVGTVGQQNFAISPDGSLGAVVRFTFASALFSSSTITSDSTISTSTYLQSTATGAAATSFYASGATSGAFQTASDTFKITSGQADGASAVAARSDTTATYSTAGAKLWSWRNNGVEKAYVDKDGAVIGRIPTDNVQVGVANVATAAALPSCSAAGSVLQYATGGTFSCVAEAAKISAYSGPCQTGSSSSNLCAVNDLAWPGGYISARTGATIAANATCSCLVAGTGGTTYTLQLFDNGVAVGSSPAVSCTTAAGTDFVAAFGSQSTTAGHHYTVSKHTTTCTTQPGGCACILQVTP
jgi:hypothetical protein